MTNKIIKTSNTKRPVTIKDVASRADVAISTVSRVLNDQDRVSNETREKVQKAAAELGFVKNSLAASMKTGSTKLIVVAVPDLINEYYTNVIRGVEQVAVQYGYYTIVFTTQESPDKEKELFEGKFGRIIDGAIIVPAHPDVEFLRSINKPVVVVDRYVAGCQQDAVMIENFKGSYLLMQEFIANGHEKIAIINGPENFNVGKERADGYRTAMKQAELPIVSSYMKNTSWYIDGGYESTMELLKLPEPPTAILATNNLICIGCAEAITNQGLVIGKDISLAGFDDSAFAEFVSPGITVARRATEEMGVIGAEKLFDKLLKRNPPKYQERKIVLDISIVRRGSIAKLN
ncbi:MAG: LacI family DNA-binding transcriptional regulator [Eubacteriales bacterium]|nr:LacI family DNA-binding transcriptional regulator [Eubacteriales bacterium]